MDEWDRGRVRREKRWRRVRSLGPQIKASARQNPGPDRRVTAFPRQPGNSSESLAADGAQVKSTYRGEGEDGAVRIVRIRVVSRPYPSRLSVSESFPGRRASRRSAPRHGTGARNGRLGY